MILKIWIILELIAALILAREVKKAPTVYW